MLSHPGDTTGPIAVEGGGNGVSERGGKEGVGIERGRGGREG